MSGKPEMEEALREHIIAQPDVILEDQDLMRALVSANERAMGENIVDLRGIAMKRLETRLDRLEDTHRSVIAAAYENLAGTNQVHRAVLRMLDPFEFETFLTGLSGEVAHILRVDTIRLVLETVQKESDPVVKKLEGMADETQFAEWSSLLYDQALVAEGSPPSDPVNFAKRITRLLEAKLG